MSRAPTPVVVAAVAAPLPAVQLKDFEVTERLGSGSYGDVYKARGKTGERKVVAVKCVLKSKLSKAETDNLVTEIKLLKELKHEHIVHMIDFRWDANYIMIIMEYCGIDLSKFIKSRKSLPEDVCRRFLQQLASALKFLRSKNVSHMDLKPSNILLTTAGSKRPVLKLADFGFAQYLSGESSSIRGSLLYMAPEMVKGRTYGPEADLWSTGVILFEAPYKSTTLEELRFKIQEKTEIEIPKKANISENCRDLLSRLLQKDPALRISFEDFFDHPFLDLEHVPSEESYAKAVSLVEQAVRKDKAGQLAEALSLYKSALEYFIPMVQSEKNTRAKRDALRSKTTQYIERAEAIKAELFPESSVKKASAQLQKRSSTEMSSLDELMSLSNVSPKLMTGLEIAQTAEFYEIEGQYMTAQAKYRSALGILLPLVGAEPIGRRRTLLLAEVDKWLKRAEYVEQVLEVQNKVLSQDSREVGSGSGSDKQCSVQ